MGACLHLMSSGPHDYFIVILFPLFIGITFWIQRQPQFDGKRYFVMANWSVTAWLLSVALELFSVEPHCKILAGTLAYPGIGLLPASWFLFVYRYTQHETGPILPWQWCVLIGVPAFANLIAITNPLHQLFYGPGTAPVSSVPGSPVNYVHGPLFYLLAATLYAFILASLALLGNAVRQSAGIARMLYVLLIAMTVLPTFGNIGYIVFGLNIAGFDPTPFLFSFLLLAYAALISLNNFFQVSSIAKDMVFDTLPNAVIVVRRDGQLVAHNREAERIFGPGARTLPVGGQVAELDPLMQRVTAPEPVTGPTEMMIGEREFEVSSTPLTQTNRAGRQIVIGYAFVFFEVTAYRQIERELAHALSTTDARLGELALQNRRISDEVRTDPLTGLLNRRSLSDAFTAMSRTEEDTIFAVLIDIDHFKKINDRFGHGVGDQVLAAFGIGLKRAFRSEDKLYRLGGEEFLALLPNIGLQELHGRIAGLRLEIGQMGSQFLPADMDLQFSAGIAVMPTDSHDLAELLDLADKRLYSAKNRGRNRTVGPLAEKRV